MQTSGRRLDAIFLAACAGAVALAGCGGGGGSRTVDPPVAQDPATRASGRWSVGSSFVRFESPSLTAPSLLGGALLLRPRAADTPVGALALRSAAAWRTAAIGNPVVAVESRDGVFDVLTGSGSTLYWDRLPEDPAMPNAARMQLAFGVTLPGPQIVRDGTRRYLIASGGLVARLGQGFEPAWTRRWLGADWALGRGVAPRLVAARQATAGTMQVVALDADAGTSIAAEVQWPEPAGFAWAAEDEHGVLVGNFVQTPVRAVLVDPTLGSQTAWRIERTTASYALDFARPLGRRRMIGTIHVRAQSVGNDVAITRFAADGSVAWAHGYRIETPVGHVALHDVLSLTDGLALLVCRSYPANDPEELTMAVAVVGDDGEVRGAMAIRGVDDLSLQPLANGGYLAHCAYGAVQLDQALQPLRSWAGVDVREQGGRLWYLRRPVRGVAAGDVFGRLDAEGLPGWAVQMVGMALDTEADFVGQTDGSAVLAWADAQANFAVATARSDGSSSDACALRPFQDILMPLEISSPAVFRDNDLLLLPDAPMAVPIGSPVESIAVTATPDAAPPASLPVVVPVCGG